MSRADRPSMAASKTSRSRGESIERLRPSTGSVSLTLRSSSQGVRKSSIEPMKAPPSSGKVGASGKPHQARDFRPRSAGGGQPRASTRPRPSPRATPMTFDALARYAVHWHQSMNTSRARQIKHQVGAANATWGIPVGTFSTPAAQGTMLPSSVAIADRSRPVAIRAAELASPDAAPKRLGAPTPPEPARSLRIRMPA